MKQAERLNPGLQICAPSPSRAAGVPWWHRDTAPSPPASKTKHKATAGTLRSVSALQSAVTVTECRDNIKAAGLGEEGKEVGAQHKLVQPGRGVEQLMNVVHYSSQK